MKAVIFYVEDHMEEVNLFRYFLKKYADKVELINFENGLLFLDYLSHNKDSLVKEHSKRKYCILLDIDLPCLSGIDLIKRIKELPKPISQIPIIMYSSSQREHHKSESLEAGAVLYMEKPFDYEGMAANMKFLYENYLGPQKLTH